MLVLSREKDELFRIGDDIRVGVVDIRGHKVRIGVDAPRSVAVHREEVYQAIQRQAGRIVEPLPFGNMDRDGLLKVRLPVLIVQCLERSTIETPEFEILKAACRKAMMGF